MTATAISNLRTYVGCSEIQFFSDENCGLSVTIHTKRLHIRSVEATEAEYDRYARLFGDQDVMTKFATGETTTRDAIKEKIKSVWRERWDTHDPYSGLAVFKKGTEDFVGHVVLGHGDHPGEAELAGLWNTDFWRQGYGFEAATAIVQEYAPATVQEGYLLNGKPLQTIFATARVDNEASCGLLEKIGMSFVCEKMKHESLRRLYQIDLGNNFPVTSFNQKV